MPFFLLAAMSGVHAAALLPRHAARVHPHRCTAAAIPLLHPRHLRCGAVTLAEGRTSAAVTQEKSAPRAGGLVDLQPPRGTRDFYPEDMALRNWLFGAWRRVASAHGFEEYDAPVLESEARSSTFCLEKWRLLHLSSEKVASPSPFV